jgi:hypothetical protein
VPELRENRALHRFSSSQETERPRFQTNAQKRGRRSHLVDIAGVQIAEMIAPRMMWRVGSGGDKRQ